MPRAPYADIPGHKQFDADLRQLASLAKKLAEQAASKQAAAKSEKQRAGFAAIAASLEAQCKAAVEARGMLWDATE